MDPARGGDGRAERAVELVIRAGQVVSAEEVLTDAVVEISGGRITHLGAAAGRQEPTHWYPDATVVPGMIDVHVHGCGGWRVGADEGDPDVVLGGMRRALASMGVTSFLATIATAEDEVTVAALRSVVRLGGPLEQDGSQGALVLGSHLEGPYLNPKRKGAMRPDLMRAPDVAHFETLWDTSEGSIRYITLAPELDGAKALIPLLTARAVHVSAGHTDALHAEMLEAFEWGVSGVTHVFNAMRGIHHREPGVAGAALSAPGVWVELIGDGIHVHPDVMRLVIAAKGPRWVTIISDAGRYAGMPSGTYHEGHRTMVIEGYRCAYPDGTLAGSASPMNHNLMLLRERLELPWPTIAMMTAANPARMLGVADRKGRLAPGMDADLVVLGPTGDVEMTVIGGLIAHVRADGDGRTGRFGGMGAAA